jgi:muramoyltetrapeptide carboxypeptidase LdcA involved in peptidoglycan recycling
MVSVPKVNTFEIARNVHKTLTGYSDSSVLDNRPAHCSLRMSEVGHNRANGTAVLDDRTWGYCRRKPGES